MNTSASRRLVPGFDVRGGLALLAALATAPVTFADVLPTIEARIALDGMMRPGRVVPVIVEVSNPGIGVRGQVVVSRPGGGQQSRRSIELPSGSRKRVTVYVDAGEYDSSFEISLRVRGLTLAAVELEAQPIDAARSLVVMVGAEGWGLTRYVKDETHPLNLAIVDAPDAPERWYGWDAADVVVWPERTGEPSPAAARALARWVELGGTLVLAVGADGRGLGGLAPLAGGTISAGAAMEQRELLQSLDLEPRADPEGARVPVSDVAPGPGARVLNRSRDGRPLVVEAPRGFGRVVVFAFDPAVARMAGAGGAGEMLVELLRVPEASPVDSSNQYRGDMTVKAAESFVAGIPPLRPISLRFLLLFMTAYVLIVGPIDYLVLKRLGRMTLTWVTYPVTIVVFSALAYGFATSMKGNAMIVTAVEIVDRVTGADAVRRTTLLGIFAVERRSYRITADSEEGHVAWHPSGGTQAGSFLLGSSDVAKVDDGIRMQLELPILIFNQGQVLGRERLPPKPGPLVATVEAPTVGSRPMPLGAGRDLLLRNDGKALLRGVAVVGRDGRVVTLGDLSPGESRRLSEGATSMPAVTFVSSSLIELGSAGTEVASSPWRFERDGERLVGVDPSMATSLAVGVTIPGPSGVLASAPRFGSLDLAHRIEDGAWVVVAHEVVNEPASARVGGSAPACQTLRIHRLVVDGVDPEADDEEGA